VTTTLAPTILRLNLVLKQGAGAVITLTVVDKLGAPITDPTGYGARAQIRTSDGEIVFEWNSAGGPGTGDAVLTYSTATSTSTLALSITGTQTASLTFPGLAAWDVFLTHTTDQPACLAEGTVVLDPLVTA
jgi:hypothetical protein